MFASTVGQPPADGPHNSDTESLGGRCRTPSPEAPQLSFLSAASRRMIPPPVAKKDCLCKKPSSPIRKPSHPGTCHMFYVLLVHWTETYSGSEFHWTSISSIPKSSIPPLELALLRISHFINPESTAGVPFSDFKASLWRCRECDRVMLEPFAGRHICPPDVE